MTELANQSIEVLKAKLNLLNRIIREAKNAGDPRADEAERQARIINKTLVDKIKNERAERGEPEPEQISVGLKALSLMARAPRAGGSKNG